MEKNLIKREEVVKAENKLFSAQLTSDVAVLDELLDDSLVAVAPMGQIVTKQMDLDSHKAKTMIIEDATTEINDIVINGDIAMAVVTMKAKGMMMGTPLEGTFKYFRVWKRYENSLKIIGASIMQLN